MYQAERRGKVRGCGKIRKRVSNCNGYR